MGQAINKTVTVGEDCDMAWRLGTAVLDCASAGADA